MTLILKCLKMRKRYFMKIKNVSIDIDELHFKNNHLPRKSAYNLNPELSRTIGSEGEDMYYTQIELRIENTEERPFPMDLLVVVKALFKLTELNEDEDNKDIEDFLKYQGVHILYPYLRSTVSALTSISMFPPIVLPIINSRTLFKDDKGEEINSRGSID